METRETQGDYMGLMRFFILIKTKGTHETQRLKGTQGTQGDSGGIMRLRKTTVDS